LDLILSFLDIMLHLKDHLSEWGQRFGPWLYVILFLVIFCETGLVVTPFLPGDSLLFAIGTLCTVPGMPLEVHIVIPLLIVAAVLGDAVNYSVGYRAGPAVFKSERSRLFNKKHLLKTQAFYERYGGKTIIIARFVPIVRTFAPFVAGIGKMGYRRFFVYNVVGAIVWVTSLVAVGYAFAGHPLVQKQFHYVIVGIIVISVLPMAIEILREWLRLRKPPEPPQSPNGAKAGEPAE
jgi:membrane-associated protein